MVVFFGFSNIYFQLAVSVFTVLKLIEMHLLTAELTAADTQRHRVRRSPDKMPPQFLGKRIVSFESGVQIK